MIRSKCLNKVKYGCLALLLGSSLAIGACIQPIHNHNVSAHRVASYDISQWQGNLTNNEVKQLKKETHFMILRGEYGSSYRDNQVSHTMWLLKRNHIPFGVYDYSIYHNSKQAKEEAKALHSRTPYAKFYVNDAEENDAGSRFNSATQAWSNEMKHLTNRPVVLYSGLYFMNEHMTSRTRHSYNANWLASYSSYQPRTKYHYDLWQYTDAHHSKALRQNVDANIIPKGSNKPMSFWTGKGHSHKTVIHKAPKMKAINMNSIQVHFHSVK